MPSANRQRLNNSRLRCTAFPDSHKHRRNAAPYGFNIRFIPFIAAAQKISMPAAVFLFCFGNILICNAVKLIRNVVFIADAGLIVVHTLHVKRPVGRHGYHGAAALRAFF